MHATLIKTLRKKIPLELSITERKVNNNNYNNNRREKKMEEKKKDRNMRLCSLK